MTKQEQIAKYEKSITINMARIQKLSDEINYNKKLAKRHKRRYANEIILLENQITKNERLIETLKKQ